MREMGKEREALVLCGDRNMGIGITVWDIETEERLLRIPSCASSPHGLLCLRDRFLVASQVNKHGSVGGGSVLSWSLNKPQNPIRSYPIEAIGPLCCTKEGVYIVGGARSGNAYIWEVANGRLLKTWRAHQKSLKCVVFNSDDSLLISGSEDGTICIWSMVGLIDVENFGSSSRLLYCVSEHQSSITGLLTTSGITNHVMISSSLDATCKVWNILSGCMIQSREYPTTVNTITMDPLEQRIFAGSIDGRIFVSELDIGLLEDPCVITEERLVELEGHNESITALKFSRSGLISASKDSTVCLWDVVNWTIVRRFTHQKGPVTNILVIPQSSLPSASNNQRSSTQSRISPLEKCTQTTNSSNQIIALPSSCPCSDKDHSSSRCKGATSLGQQILEIEQRQTPEAMQLKLETSIDDRMWATRMTKHIMAMNKHLQSRLLDLMHIRLLLSKENESLNIRKTKKQKMELVSLHEENSCKTVN